MVGGARTIFDIVDVRTAAGSAGIAVDVSRTEAIRTELQRTLKSPRKTLDMLDYARWRSSMPSSACNFYNHGLPPLWNLDMAFLESHPTMGSCSTG